MNIVTPSITSEITGGIDPRIPHMGETVFDATNILSIDQVRIHCKIEDVPSVTDPQITLYIKSAIEVAEKYLGWYIGSVKQHVETVPEYDPMIGSIRASLYTNEFSHSFRPFINMELKYPTYDGVVYIFGYVDGSAPKLLRVTPGSTRIKIPSHLAPQNIADCCRPCGNDGQSGIRVAYRAGFKCVDDIPAGVIVGMLKLIAWYISNPGDEIMTVRNRQSRSDTGIVGTNNAALVSGAIEQWRIYMTEAY